MFSRNVGFDCIGSSNVFIVQCGQTSSYKDGPVRPSVCVFNCNSVTNFDEFWYDNLLFRPSQMLTV
jgi:hypothetical protein